MGAGQRVPSVAEEGARPKVERTHNGVFNRRRFEFRPLRRCNGRYLSCLDVPKPCISRGVPERGLHFGALFASSPALLRDMAPRWLFARMCQLFHPHSSAVGSPQRLKQCLPPGSGRTGRTRV